MGYLKKDLEFTDFESLGQSHRGKGVGMQTQAPVLPPVLFLLWMQKAAESWTLHSTHASGASSAPRPGPTADSSGSLEPDEKNWGASWGSGL